MCKIFVYGTLKKGYPNYNEYLSQAHCLGKYRTVEKYPLVIANKRYSPVLIPESGIGYHVLGEVYKVDKTLLHKLDDLESIGLTHGYMRNKISVANIDNKKIIQCFSYFKLRENLNVIHSDYLHEYLDDRYIKKL